MTAPSAPFLELSGLTKRYSGVTALDSVSATIHTGRVLGLVGKNGAGKSTLIKILGGSFPQDEGTIAVNGEVINFQSPKHSERLGISVVSQELLDVPNLTVAENVYLGLGYPRRLGLFVGRRALERRASEVLERFDADIDPRALMSDLSVAQRRLVMIARGVAANQRLLILDEPSASLTTHEIDHIHALVRKLRDDGVGVVYVTHRLDEIFAISDDVMVMRDGSEVARHETSELSMPGLIEHITGHAQPVEVSEGVPVEVPVEHDRARSRLTPTASPTVLEVQGLRVKGVEDASFSLRAGEILGIAGLVGAGRTELARAVYGADKPEAGTVTMAGTRLKAGSPRSALENGVVLLPEDRRGQGNVLGFSIRANISLPSLSRFRSAAALPFPSKAKEEEATRALMSRLSISAAGPEQLVGLLSGGNQQKVVLAKWLERGAEVFIFDEPTHGVDVEGKDDVYRTMEDLAARGKGVIFISSEFAELVSVCTRVLVMREGRLVAELEGDEISQKSIVEWCYTDPEDLEELIEPATAP